MNTEAKPIRTIDMFSNWCMDIHFPRKGGIHLPKRARARKKVLKKYTTPPPKPVTLRALLQLKKHYNKLEEYLFYDPASAYFNGIETNANLPICLDGGKIGSPVITIGRIHQALVYSGHAERLIDRLVPENIVVRADGSVEHYSEDESFSVNEGDVVHYTLSLVEQVSKYTTRSTVIYQSLDPNSRDAWLRTINQGLVVMYIPTGKKKTH